MAANGKIPMADEPRATITWTDALILGVAVLGVLLGLSFLSFEIAVAVGLVLLGYVIAKLLTTKK